MDFPSTVSFIQILTYKIYNESTEFSAKSFKGRIYKIGGTNTERKVLCKVSPLYSRSEEMPEMNNKRQRHRGPLWLSSTVSSA